MMCKSKVFTTMYKHVHCPLIWAPLRTVIATISIPGKLEILRGSQLRQHPSRCISKPARVPTITDLGDRAMAGRQTADRRLDKLRSRKSEHLLSHSEDLLAVPETCVWRTLF